VKGYLTIESDLLAVSRTMRCFVWRVIETFTRWSEILVFSFIIPPSLYNIRWLHVLHCSPSFSIQIIEEKLESLSNDFKKLHADHK